MSKLVWPLIVIMMLHALFTCAAAAGHIDDPLHSVDVSYANAQTHLDSHTQNIDSSQEHDFHAHVSCIIGYNFANVCSPAPVKAFDFNLISFDSQRLQPPIPPPNA